MAIIEKLNVTVEKDDEGKYKVYYNKGELVSTAFHDLVGQDVYPSWTL